MMSSKVKFSFVPCFVLFHFFSKNMGCMLVFPIVYLFDAFLNFYLFSRLLLNVAIRKKN